jgi:PAS domain S-box-containing protein
MIAALLAAVIAIFAALVFNEMRRQAEEQHAERARTASAQIAMLLDNGVRQQVAQVAAASVDSSLRLAAASPSERTLRPAEERLRLLQSSSPMRDAIQLWDADGELLVDVPAPEGLAVPNAPRERPRMGDGDSVTLSNIHVDSGATWFDVVAAVRDGDRQAGYLVRRRRLTSTPAAGRTVELINRLIGVDARFMLGHPATGWTDLLGPAAGPTNAIATSGGMHSYVLDRRDRRVGTAEPIAGTPWYVWVEFPHERVYGRSMVFLRRISFIGLIIALLGALTGWLLSRPITQPLGALTDAATKMAAGDYEHRLGLTRRDELGHLGAAFDRMAASVQEARAGLEGQVEQRTHELQETLVRLSASEQQFRSLASSSGAAIVTADPDGAITFMNPTGESMFGYAPGELVGRPIAVLMPPADRATIESRTGRMLHAGDSGSHDRTMEFTARRKDGSDFPVELSLASWVVDGKRSTGGVIRDITERKTMQASLEERALSLEAANKELAAFSYSVSHDLRAPLRGLQGFSEALLEDYGDKLDARGLDYLHRVSEAAGRMGRLIDELLELSRVSRTELRREPVELGPLVTLHLEELQRLEPERKVACVTHPVPPAIGDERLISLVIQNLIENAWKFTRQQPNPRIEFGTEGSRDGFPVYLVRDNGAGFDLQYADKLFGVFQRLHAETEFPGTGVGLAIVQRIILRHGGEIWAEAAPGQGATFHFTLGGRNVPAGIEA